MLPKIGQDSENENNIRPAKVKYELYCKYPLYTVDPQTHKATPTGEYYDGLVSDSAAQRAVTNGKCIFDDALPQLTGNICETILDADNNWTETFTNLPVFFNYSGDETYPGAEVQVPITYYVKETLLDQNGSSGDDNSYDTNKKADYICPEKSSDTDLTGAGTKSLTVTNELDTRSITVSKIWNDNGFIGDKLYKDAKSLHYAIDVTLKSTGTFEGIYTCTKTMSVKSDGTCDTITFDNVPKYSGGKEITYEVTEKVHNSEALNKFGYVCTVESTKQQETRSDLEGFNLEYTDSFTITNTLPLTSIEINKEWLDDEPYKDILRPSSLTFRFFRANNDNNGNPVWSNNVRFEDQILTQENALSDNDNKWRYTIENLLMYDENNYLNSYRLIENDPKIYSMDFDKPVDGESEFVRRNVQPFEIIGVRFDTRNAVSIHKAYFKNTLITKDIKIRKKWDFNNCTEPKRYDITVNLNSVSPQGLDFTETLSKDATLDRNNCTEYITIKKVPVYYLNEKNVKTRIGYDLTETKSYGYEYIGLNGEDITSRGLAETVAAFTKNNQVIADDTYILQYTITNKLPTTSVVVTKTWEDYDDMYNLRPKKLNLTLYRTTNPDLTNKGKIGENEAAEWVRVPKIEGTPEPKQERNTWIYSFNDLLKYSQDNIPYRFMVVEEYGEGLMAYKTIEPQTAGYNDSKNIHDASITNTLDTQDISVTKTWNDLYNRYDTRHDLEFTLSCDVLLTGKGREQKPYSEALKLKSDETEVVFRNLPKYNADGTPYNYQLEEQSFKGTVLSPAVIDRDNHFTQTTTKFGYEGSCRMHTSVETINETQRTYIDRFDVTNTLPTKDITVNKVWDDLSNTYGLRPDSIKFDVSRTTKTGNTTDSDWEKVTEYTLNDKNSDTWTDTVTKLLQYSETNEPFRFKFDEHTVHAYDNVLTGNDINHEADNNNVVNFKNKLKTGSVKVNKIWNDNGYSQPDHYKLKITLSDDNDILNTGHQIFTEYIETAAGSTTGTVTFLDLPIEDTNGDSIQYTVSEATESGTPAYYYHYDAQYSSTTVVPTPTGEPSEVTITNTLPLRDITITKNWQDDSNKFDLRPESVNFNVYRRTKTTEEWTLVSPSCYRSVSSGTDSDSWTINITKLLKYSRENELYSYKIEEDNSGYCSYIIPEAQEVSFSENSDAASVTFTNRLEYQYIKVTKIWNDNGVAGANNLHYDLDITLTSVTPVFKMKNSSNTYSDYTDTQIISASDNTPVIFGKLPVRAADGTLFRFSVTESVHTGGVSITPPTRDTSGLFDFVQQSNQYGYTATFAVSNSNETHEGDGYPVIPVTVTNILPFTSVEVTKTWYDTINGTVNKYDLRPTSIALQLQRNSDISNSNGWSNIGGLVTLNTDEKGANVDEWKYTFNKLLRYDESNREYTFKVNESFPQNDGGAYIVNTDAVTTANTDSKTLAISNTLKKRDVTVNKVWVDNDCTDSDLAHYDIDVHLTPNESEGISDIQKLVFEIDENDQQYKIESDKDSVTIKDVPICDKNGDLITFVPDERPSDENDQHNWGDTYYRYVKTISSAPENTNSDVSVSNPIVSYTITNTLPVTTVTVTKKWEITDFHKYGKQNITVDVYRRINNSTESKIEENNVIYFSTVNNNDKNADYIDSYSTNKKHLQYDRNNNKYIYRAEEVGKYAGFTPEYSTPETTTTPDNITLGIINKQIRGEVEFTKIDGTYERLYKNDN